jgi:hypothetical protein
VNETRAFVVEAKLVLDQGCDPAAVGAAVTVELCGHWEHAVACRWPHNNAIEVGRDHALFRALFVSARAEAAGVRKRVESALRDAAEWRVLSVDAPPVAEAERPLAENLLTAPRLPG